MKAILESPSRMIPVLVVSIVIAVGSAFIILTTDSPSAAAPEASGPAQSGVVKVDIADFKYNPAAVTVKPGSKVMWTNSDAANHTATADDGSFDTGDLGQGDTATETLQKPGTYTYICSFHAFMTGTVEVK